MPLKSLEGADFKTEVIYHLSVVNWWNSLPDRLVYSKPPWFEESSSQIHAREIPQELQPN